MPKTLKINVVKVEQFLGKNKFKVKIKETNVNLATLNHNGRNFKVLNNLGRGRYIMAEIKEE
jgi:hypothetical protein